MGRIDASVQNRHRRTTPGVIGVLRGGQADDRPLFTRAAGTGSSAVTLTTAGEAMSRSSAAASTVATTIGSERARAVTRPLPPMSPVTVS